MTRSRLARSKRHTGITGTHHAGRLIAKHSASAANHAAIADGHAGSDKHVSSQPNLPANRHLASSNRKVDQAKIMVASAQIGTLGNDRIGTDFNLPQAVKHRFITNPGSGPDSYFPRVCDHDGRADDGSGTDLCAESPQQPGTKSIKRLRRATKQRRLNQPPKLHIPAGPTTKPLGQAKRRKVLSHGAALSFIDLGLKGPVSEAQRETSASRRARCVALSCRNRVCAQTCARKRASRSVSSHIRFSTTAW